MYSMTAFARVQVQNTWGFATWELRAVNHRFLDIHFKIPENLRALENDWREAIGEHAKRGKIDCSLSLKFNQSQNRQLSLNTSLLNELVALEKEAATHLGAVTPATCLTYLNYPGVVSAEEMDLTTIQAELNQGLNEALESLNATRLREGDKLRTFMSARLTKMREHVEILRAQLPELIEKHRQKILEKLEVCKKECDEQRLEQEMVLFMNRIDVAEECDRLEAHIDEVARVLNSGSSIGRRLDFLMQEINRESNTIGSKSFHKLMTQQSVELKVLTEQLREQVQNVE